MFRAKWAAALSALATMLMFAAMAVANGQPPPPNDNANNTAAVCHKPGTPAQKTLYVAPTAVAGHIGHGDSAGECEGEGE